MTYDGRNRFAILLSIRVLIRREISRLLTVFNFRVDRSLGSKELESAREGEREREMKGLKGNVHARMEQWSSFQTLSIQWQRARAYV